MTHYTREGGGFTVAAVVVIWGSPRTIATVQLASPAFNDGFESVELCRNAGTDASGLRVECLGPHARVVRLSTRAERGTIVVEATNADEAPRIVGRFADGGCVGAGRIVYDAPPASPRFESLRNGWGKDLASPRCAGITPAVEADAWVRVRTDAANAGTAQVDVSVPSAGIRRSLGVLVGTSGATSIKELTDVRGVEISASDLDMGRRMIFQLGNRLLFTNDHDALEAVDLPCGLRIRPRADFTGADHAAATNLRDP